MILEARVILDDSDMTSDKLQRLTELRQSEKLLGGPGISELMAH